MDILYALEDHSQEPANRRLSQSAAAPNAPNTPNNSSGVRMWQQYSNGAALYLQTETEWLANQKRLLKLKSDRGNLDSITYPMQLLTLQSDRQYLRSPSILEIKKEKCCEICMETLSMDLFPSTKITKLCRHSSEPCLNCISQSLTSQLDCKAWNRLECPVCTALLESRDIEKFGTEDTIARYHRFMIADTMKGDPNFRHCLSPTYRYLRNEEPHVRAETRSAGILLPEREAANNHVTLGPIPPRQQADNAFPTDQRRTLREALVGPNVIRDTLQVLRTNLTWIIDPGMTLEEEIDLVTNVMRERNLDEVRAIAFSMRHYRTGTRMTPPPVNLR
ncbi:hypothetical protein MMC13_000799 [Lambiella insularis]|nr:hypothetical protein [Lambiella insularis]